VTGRVPLRSGDAPVIPDLDLGASDKVLGSTVRGLESRMGASEVILRGGS
jgi:hypothetical protein